MEVCKKELGTKKRSHIKLLEQVNTFLREINTPFVSFRIPTKEEWLRQLKGYDILGFPSYTKGWIQTPFCSTAYLYFLSLVVFVHEDPMIPSIEVFMNFLRLFNSGNTGCIQP